MCYCDCGEGPTPKAGDNPVLILARMVERHAQLLEGTAHDAIGKRDKAEAESVGLVLSIEELKRKHAREIELINSSLQSKSYQLDQAKMDLDEAQVATSRAQAENAALAEERRHLLKKNEDLSAVIGRLQKRVLTDEDMEILCSIGDRYTNGRPMLYPTLDDEEFVKLVKRLQEHSK